MVGFILKKWGLVTPNRYYQFEITIKVNFCPLVLIMDLMAIPVKII